MKRASLVLPLLLALPLLALACGEAVDQGETDAGVAACGDGVCDDHETLNSCPEDCATCGDSRCTVPKAPAEGAPLWSENSETCQQDCGGTYVCGNLRCESTESAELCPYDCVTCGDGTCHVDFGETAVHCDADCPPVCGDGACTTGESNANCRRDCDSGGVCGDGVCNYEEHKHNCLEDCADMCEELGVAENVGQRCGGQDGADCGQWGICVGPQGEAVCRQVCWLQQCHGVCGGGTCEGFATENPPSDQHEGVFKGACMPAPNSAYEACGEAEGGCVSGLTCSGLGGIEGSAYCMKPCAEDADCGAYGGVAGQCLVGDPPEMCVLTCDPAQSGSCPTGMNCIDAGGVGVCMWPE